MADDLDEHDGPVREEWDDEELSPLDWILELEPQIEEQTKHAQTYEPYYTNERELQIVKDEYEDVFGGSNLIPPRTNLSAVGVNATAERLRVQSFRVGHPSDDDARNRDETGDRAADELWHRNDLDVMQALCFVETLVKARTFGLVWPDRRTGRAVMTIEDPEQFAVARRSTPPYDVIAAVKIYETRAGTEVARVWTVEDGMTVFTGGGRDSGEIWTPPGAARSRRTRWTERESYPLPKPWKEAGVVPAVEFANRQRLLAEPVSHLVDVAPIADSHSKVLADLIIACSFGAVPIRTATGVTVVRDEHGNIKQLTDIRADRMMMSEKEGAKFGTLPAADLAGYASALEILLAQVRIVTRVPSHYYGEGTSSGLAGETIKASEGSLVRLVDGMKDPFAHSLRRFVSLGLQLEDAAHAAAPVRVRWTDTETRVESQMTDSATKLNTMGVPLRIILEEYLKQPPHIVEEALALREQEQREAAALLAAVEHDVALAGRASVTAAAEEELDADEVQKRANAFGTLYRSGVEPGEAARLVGLDLQKHSGALPVTLQRDAA